MPKIKLSFLTYPHLAAFLNAFSTTYTNWYIILQQSTFSNDPQQRPIITAELHLNTLIDSNQIDFIHKLAAANGMFSMEVSKPDNRILS